MSRSSSDARADKVKLLCPKGDILNDGSTDVDHLGHVVYAKALARQIQRIKTPMTVGIFARWGSGKSFLLKHVQNLIVAQQQQNIQNEKDKVKRRSKNIVTVLTSVSLMMTFLVCLMLSIIFTYIVDVPPIRSLFVGLSIVALFTILIILLSFGVSRSKGNCLRFKWVVLSALFTKLPIKDLDVTFIRTTTRQKTTLKRGQAVEGYQKEDHSLQTPEKTNSKTFRRFIFVNFNAWEYAGSDKLWAGIVTTLAEKIEEEFGIFTTRVFRTITLDTTCRNKICKSLHVTVTNRVSKDKLDWLMSHYGLPEGPKNKKIEEGKDQNTTSEDGFQSYTQELYFPNARVAQNALKDLEQLQISSVSFDSKPHTNTRRPSSLSQGKSYKKLEKGQASASKVNEKEITQQEEKRCKTQKAKMWKHFKTHPRRTCDVPNWVWCILFVIGCIFVPTTTFLTIDLVENNATELDYEHDSLSFFFGKLFSILPLGMTVAIIVLRLFWALLFSQKSRILSALKGVKGNVANELGFMNKIKEEVQSITNLIHTVEFATNIEYKVILTIDDLDRVQLCKVRAVLEAVNILLSDRNSPFICLVAIDSRIAVKSFEVPEESKEATNTAIIYGYEYLKKIINLPFCLPEIDDESKATFVSGLMDEADVTKETFQERFPHSSTDLDADGEGKSKSSNKEAQNFPDAAPYNHQRLSDNLVERGGASTSAESVEGATESCPSEFDFEEFLFHCRLFMYHGETVMKHLQGNPRNIKRIFNVISITASVMQCHHERVQHFRKWAKYMNRQPMRSPLNKAKDLAKDLVMWIVLTDQWPYRVSFILQVIEDADQRSQSQRQTESIGPTEKIVDIYRKHVIQKYLGKHRNEADEDLMKLDYDPDLLDNLLLKSNLTKERVKELLKYSINLDCNLRQTISYHTDKIDHTLRSEQTKDDKCRESNTVPDSLPPRKPFADKNVEPVKPQLEDSSPGFVEQRDAGSVLMDSKG